jgi:hypothetical protein
MTPNKVYREDLSGRTFGNWKVLNFHGYSGRNALWLCECACTQGTQRLIRRFHLFHGRRNMSCGCLGIRKGWVEDGVGYVPLTMGQTTKVDMQKVDEFSAWSWFVRKMKGKFYVFRDVRIDPSLPYSKYYTQAMARQVLGLERGDPRQVDHINLDTLDNRVSNLRIATQTQNLCNKRVRKDSKSGIKGAHLDERTGNYNVSIRYKGVATYLGTTGSVEVARSMYAEASRRLHGEFGRTE